MVNGEVVMEVEWNYCLGEQVGSRSARICQGMKGSGMGKRMEEEK